MILLIDDEPDIRKIAALSLQAVGKFDVVCAGSGPEGIALAKQLRPALVLLDIMMPGMDGMSTLAQLRSDPDVADIPVIFMTAKVQRSEVQHYLSLGALGVIPKPFDPMTLPEQVRALLKPS